MLKHRTAPQSISSLGFNTLSPEMANATNYPKWIAGYFSQWIGGKTLEVGIGFANYRRHYCCDQYIGADIDQDVVAMASRLYPEDKFFVADMAGTDFGAKAVAQIGQGQFDCVLSFNALQYVQDERLAISNLLSVVKPGGHRFKFRHFPYFGYCT